MPKGFESKAQAKAFHAAAAGRGKLGIPMRVAKEAVAENKGKSLKGLPERKKIRVRKKGGGGGARS